jgi:lipopolysaccharide transport system ATP-binding protein
MPGRYSVNVYCSVGGVMADYLTDAAVFDVDEGDFYGTGKLPPTGHGLVLVPYRWSMEQAS